MKFSTFLFFIIFGILSPFFVFAKIPDHAFPKTAAIYLNSAPISPSFAKELAKWDVVILNLQAQFSSRPLILSIRKENPNVLILAYITSVEYPKYWYGEIEQPLSDGIWTRLTAQLSSEWILETYKGEEISFWPRNVAMNLGQKNASGQLYSTYLANFLKNTAVDSGLWDGLLFDTVWNDVSWKGLDIDIDGDGKKDSKEKIDAGWFAGQKEFYRYLRSIVGNDFLIITNGVGEYKPFSNGRMLEGFPEFFEGGWNGSMKSYFSWNKEAKTPRLVILNSDTDNTGNSSNYPAVRFGLGSALLSDGYYNFDYGTEDRSSLYFYDEYKEDLGRAKTEAYLVGSSFASAMAVSGPSFFSSGIWRRDFDRGIVLVNSTSKSQKVVLESEYTRIRGVQDPVTNSGLVGKEVVVGPQDSLVLLRPFTSLSAISITNGAFASAYRPDGSTLRGGFFASVSGVSRGALFLEVDLDGDGQTERIVSFGGELTVASKGAIRCRVFPYDQTYRGEIRLGAGNLDGAGNLEIVTATGSGGGPLVRTFSSDCRLLGPGFFAYGKDFRGGVNIDVADLDGDGKAEIVTGAGAGGGPQIRIFDAKGKLIHPGFFAFNSLLRRGVEVTVLGSGKGAKIVAWIPQEGTALSEFLPSGTKLREFNLSSDSGVPISGKLNAHLRSGDIDADGVEDLVVEKVGL
ncbi:MAG: Uncharacterized protein Greene101420_879 [Parcubacteria group bacterium Greene1014_20]|nr:MAG: Uncharacterized protein Greene101420_879 [Parcubacteria group bacterium Greene1014_20]